VSFLLSGPIPPRAALDERFRYDHEAGGAIVIVETDDVHTKLLAFNLGAFLRRRRRRPAPATR
jgi:hypothetical protein